MIYPTDSAMNPIEQIIYGVQGPVLESPETFGCISGDTILFASSKQRRLEARKFAVILIFNSLYKI